MRKYVSKIIEETDDGICRTLVEREISADDVIDALSMRDDRVTVLAQDIMLAGNIDPEIMAPGSVHEIQPKYERLEEAERSTRVGRGQKGPRDPKACCGSTGSRHFKTCGTPEKQLKNMQNPPANFAARDKKTLSRQEYDAVKKAFDEQPYAFNASKYGLVNKLSPLEVKNASKSANFAEYIETF